MLAGFDLHIEPGQKVLLAGPSGSGKSTLLRAIAGLLQTADVGDLSGDVSIDGRAPQERPGWVGLLLQDPSAGVVAPTVGRDVAFGLENLAVPRSEMPRLVRRALAAARFPYGEERRTGSLSGGETQRLALAGALAMSARVLLLDEPTSMLDEHNAEAVRRSVLASCQEAGTTLVVVEHHIGPWVEHVDRCIVLDDSGAVVADGSPAAVLSEHRDSLATQGIWVPGLPAPTPVMVEPALAAPALDLDSGRPLVTVRDVTVRHRSPFPGGRRRPDSAAALADVSCDLDSGTAVVLHGASGAGKSTLLSVMAGLQQPDAGSARIRPNLAGRRGVALSRLTSRELAARLAWVAQLPEHGLVKHTVLEELLVSSRVLGRPEPKAEERARALLDVLGLSSLVARSVHHLSGGEQRRLVVAAALVHGPSGLLLDEPTVGQDRNTWAAVTGLCQSAVKSGAAICVATHDRDATHLLGRGTAGRTLALEGGRVA
ncbi:MAG: ABC transporter ATP-binding protein [Nocardioidaceae bacterium]